MDENSSNEEIALLKKHIEDLQAEILELRSSGKNSHKKQISELKS